MTGEERVMGRRRATVLGVCLAVCLLLCGGALGATIQSGQVTYWDGHYLAGQVVRTGFDVFGFNYQAHIAQSYWTNMAAGYYGFPPYAGDDAAYFQRLRDEGFVDPGWDDTAVGSWALDNVPFWGDRDGWCHFQWNDAYISKTDGSDTDSWLDWHPFTAPPYTRGHGFVGSGAVMRGIWSWHLGANTADVTWVAVPETAFLGAKQMGPESWCLCAWWYESEGGAEIGEAWWMPVADEYSFAAVREHCYCVALDAVMKDYTNPRYPAGLGGPGPG